MSEDSAENSVTSIETVVSAITGMMNEGGGEELELSLVGQRLSDKFPDFDVRNYGYSKLSVFLTEEIPMLRVHRENGHYRVGKSEEISREQIEREVISIIKENGGTVDNLAMINEELKTRYSGFDQKDYGYSRISGFLRSIRGLSVDGNVVRLKKK